MNYKTEEYFLALDNYIANNNNNNKPLDWNGMVN